MWLDSIGAGGARNKLRMKCCNRVRAGSIILLHDGDSEGKRDRRETVAALPIGY